MYNTQVPVACSAHVCGATTCVCVCVCTPSYLYGRYQTVLHYKTNNRTRIYIKKKKVFFIFIFLIIFWLFVMNLGSLNKMFSVCLVVVNCFGYVKGLRSRVAGAKRIVSGHWSPIWHSIAERNCRLSKCK